MTSDASSRSHRRLRSAIATGLVLAASVGGAGVAQAHPHGHLVSLGAGRAAIQQFASKVGNLTGASGYSLKECGRNGSDVDCHVSWSYPLGLACGVKADAYYSGNTLKVRRASGINCTSAFT